MIIPVKHKNKGDIDKDIIYKLADSNFGYLSISGFGDSEGCVLNKKDIDKIIDALTELKKSL